MTDSFKNAMVNRSLGDIKNVRLSKSTPIQHPDRP
jgi:hypothetical protein